MHFSTTVARRPASARLANRRQTAPPRRNLRNQCGAQHASLGGANCGALATWSMEKGPEGPSSRWAVVGAHSRSWPKGKVSHMKSGSCGTIGARGAHKGGPFGLAISDAELEKSADSSRLDETGIEKKCLEEIIAQEARDSLRESWRKSFFRHHFLQKAGGQPAANVGTQSGRAKWARTLARDPHKSEHLALRCSAALCIGVQCRVSLGGRLAAGRRHARPHVSLRASLVAGRRPVWRTASGLWRARRRRPPLSLLPMFAVPLDPAKVIH